ncbi:MAG: hypothetical protein ABSF12_13140 [Bryobacteraceae bacterium]|jgi:hypothetical protein
MALLSANMAVCETVLWEKKSDVPTLVRAMTALNLGSGNNLARFFVVTGVYSQPGDYLQHTLRVTATDQAGNSIAHAAPYNFAYGYELDPNGPGGFILTTSFDLDVSQLRLPLHCLISAFLDNEPRPVASTPLMLRRV